jgi:hypothetical protein
VLGVCANTAMLPFLFVTLVFNNCLLVWLLQLVIQLRVDLHVCKYLFAHWLFVLAYMYIEILPTVLALDNTFTVRLFFLVEERTLRQVR